MTSSWNFADEGLWKYLGSPSGDRTRELLHCSSAREHLDHWNTQLQYMVTVDTLSSNILYFLIFQKISYGSSNTNQIKGLKPIGNVLYMNQKTSYDTVHEMHKASWKGNLAKVIIPIIRFFSIGGALIQLWKLLWPRYKVFFALAG